MEKLDSTRRPPVLRENAQKESKPKWKTARNKHDDEQTRHVRFQASCNPPRPDLIKRIWNKMAKQVQRVTNTQACIHDEGCERAVGKHEKIETAVDYTNNAENHTVRRQELREKL